MTKTDEIELQQETAVELEDELRDEALDRTPLVQVTEYSRRGP